MGSIPGSGRSPGEGNGNPLQRSCLENSMYRGAWWATAHGVAKESDTTEWAKEIYYISDSSSSESRCITVILVFLLSCFQADSLFVCKFAFPGQVPLAGLVLQVCGLKDAKGLLLRSYQWEWAAYRRILLFWYFVYHSYSYFGQICSISCFKSLAFAFLSGIQKPFQFHVAKSLSFTSSSRKNNNYHLPVLQDERMFIKQLEHLPEKS